MVEQYFTCMIGSDLKPGVGNTNTYNGDVTESDLQCWSLSAKTCSFKNVKSARKKENKTSKRWKKTVNRNKSFAILFDDYDELSWEKYFTNDIPNHKLTINKKPLIPKKETKIGCLYVNGDTHTFSDDMPLSLSCPTCWSSFRAPPMGDKVERLKTPMKDRKKLFKKRNIGNSSTQKFKKVAFKGISPANKVVRNLRKAAVDQVIRSKRKELQPGKTDVGRSLTDDFQRMSTRKIRKCYVNLNSGNYTPSRQCSRKQKLKTTAKSKECHENSDSDVMTVGSKSFSDSKYENLICNDESQIEKSQTSSISLTGLSSQFDGDNNAKIIAQDSFLKDERDISQKTSIQNMAEDTPSTATMPVRDDQKISSGFGEQSICKPTTHRGTSTSGNISPMSELISTNNNIVDEANKQIDPLQLSQQVKQSDYGTHRVVEESYGKCSGTNGGFSEDTGSRLVLRQSPRLNRIKQNKNGHELNQNSIRQWNRKLRQKLKFNKIKL